MEDILLRSSKEDFTDIKIENGTLIYKNYLSYAKFDNDIYVLGNENIVFKNLFDFRGVLFDKTDLITFYPLRKKKVNITDLKNFILMPQLMASETSNNLLKMLCGIKNKKSSKKEESESEEENIVAVDNDYDEELQDEELVEEESDSVQEEESVSSSESSENELL